MANTFELISSYTVSGSSTNSITFNVIPNTYGHLILYVSSRANVGGYYTVNNLVQINSQSTASTYVGNYAYTVVGSPNTISTVGSNPSVWIGGTNNNTANYFSNNWTFIGNYNSNVATNCRPFTGGNEADSNSAIVYGGARQPTAAAITSLTLKELSGNNYLGESTFYLYGIKNS